MPYNDNIMVILENIFCVNMMIQCGQILKIIIDFSDIKFERHQYLYPSLILIIMYHIAKDGEQVKILMME